MSVPRTERRPSKDRYDVVIVGGGHNALVAAAYLGGAGLSVLVAERLEELGGATASVRAFPEFDARVSRYSYLVSLLPDQIVRELGLDFRTQSRSVSSFTPIHRDRRDTALLVGRDGDGRTAESFRALTGGDGEFERWREFYDDCRRLAAAMAPTMLEPLPSRAQMRGRLGDETLWESFIERPIGELIEERFTDDVVRGVVLTDALIGTFTSAHDPSLLANRCFLYHVIGNSDGEWKVPVGGMGALVDALVSAARQAGAEFVTGSPVVAISADGTAGEVELADGRRIAARFVLSNAAPRTLSRLLGDDPPADAQVEGCQLKLNMLLKRLPRLRCGIDPTEAFAGTFHLDEGYRELQAGYDAACGGNLPSPLPGELYCHSLTDPTILGPDLQAAGFHTLTLFGLHLPATLFDADNDAVRQVATDAYIAGLDAYLVDPLEECLARDADGRACIEAKSPLDLDVALDLPRGNIFHRELDFPFDDERAGRWGVETAIDNVMLCGAGAVRGGGVSGIAGHNAAMAVLQHLGRGK